MDMTYCPYEIDGAFEEWGDVANPMGPECMKCTDRECIHNENFGPEDVDLTDEELEFYRDMKVSHSPDQERG